MWVDSRRAEGLSADAAGRAVGRGRQDGDRALVGGRSQLTEACDAAPQRRGSSSRADSGGSLPVWPGAKGPEP